MKPLDKSVEGRGSALVTPTTEGKYEGVPARAKDPEDKVRRLQRRLYVCAKRKGTRRFHALFARSAGVTSWPRHGREFWRTKGLPASMGKLSR
jgi:hypothetical protein